MLQRRLLCIIYITMIFARAHAQEVNLQTGSASFSLPMFNWKDDKSHLYMAVSLDYSSGSGVKVSEMASNVGQGWNLSAGGVIVRLPIGEPDDQVQHGNNNNEHDITKYPDGFLHTSISPGRGCPLALTKYPIYGAKNERYRQHNDVAADKQLDYFSFQFNGKTGLFVLDPAAGANKCVSLGDTKMIISFTEDPGLSGQNIRTTITSFTIQDDDGLIYRFKDHGMNKVLETKFCDKYVTQFQTQPDLKPGGVYHQAGFENPDYINPWIIGSWYLSEIEDPLTHRTVTFTYETRPITSEAGADISWDSWHDYIIISHKTSVAQVPFISSIVYPDGNKATFKYGKDRFDMPGDKALTAVDFTYSAKDRSGNMETRYLSRYLIKTSYFILNRYGTPANDYQKKMSRLCLRSVTKLGPDLKEDAPPYSFDYYLGSNSIEDFVPPVFCASHDIWGYFNGMNSTGYSNNEAIFPTIPIGSLNFNQLKGLCFLHSSVTGVYLNAKAGYAKNGLLKQIIYPTGSTLSYEYAQNTGVLDVDGNGPVQQVGGVHVSKTSTTDGGYSNGCANPMVTQYNYVTSTGQPSLWGLEMPRNTTEMGMHYEPEKRNYRWSLRKCSGGLLGCCYYAYVNPGIMSQTQSVSLNDFQKFMVNNEETLGVISGIMSILDIVVVATGSTGVLAVVAVVVDAISSILELGVSCLKDNSKDGTSITYHSMDMNGVSPLPAQFKRVEVIQGSGAAGKTVHTFTSNEDYPIWVKTNPNLSARQRFGPWLYGLPKLTTDYDAQGLKVKEIDRRYFDNLRQRILEPTAAGTPTPPNGIPTNLVNCKCVIKKSTSQRYTDWVKPEEYGANYQLTDYANDLGVEFYPLYTGRVLPDSTYEREYRKGDDQQYIETLTTYSFDMDFEQIVSVNVKSSDGSERIKYTNYSKTLSGGLIDVMKQNNMLTIPIRTIEWSTTEGYLNENVTEFARTGNGDIRPWRTLSERTDHPVKLMQDWTFYGGPGNTDYSKYKISSLLTYDANDNLITAKDEGGRSIANIYDYNDKFVVASVKNADATDDKPAYTSFETNSRGGWTCTGTANYDPNAVTGNWSLNLAGSTCSANLNTAKPYILSFWANNSSVNVSGGATLVKSAPVINGFTYYEYNIAAGTAMVSLTGNALIDELRIYPQNARMRTVTYDPVIGKTSECDENNHVEYYEYDNLARLLFVKDENRNIVKSYEYNNVFKQSGCPGTYTNQLIVQNFTKNDCGPDYAGSEEPYTIPANKYTSTISQEDADAQAEFELMQKGQKNANDVGHCSPYFYNAGRSETFQSECEEGYVGGNVVYTVPPRRYKSLIQGEVEQLEADDIKANGQAYANDPANAICLVDQEPDWEMIDGGQTECRIVDGKGHLFIQAIDVNPNSPSYNTTSFQDSGPNAQCPDGYPNDDQSGIYYNWNCPGGVEYAWPVWIDMPAGSVYASTKDEANRLARQKAQDDVNSRGDCKQIPYGIDWFNGTNDNTEIFLYNTTTNESWYIYATQFSSGRVYLTDGYYNVTFSPANDDFIHIYSFGCNWQIERRGQVDVQGLWQDQASDCGINVN